MLHTEGDKLEVGRVVMVTATAGEVRNVPLHLSREGGQVGGCHKERN